MSKANSPLPPGTTSAASIAALSPQTLAGRILVIRGQRVLLDSDLAQLYGVETKKFNQQIKPRWPPKLLHLWPVKLLHPGHGSEMLIAALQ